jgi:hypothetical protein
MKPWLPPLLDRTPAIVKRQALIQLYKATAAAFSCDMPWLRGLSREACLLSYARFTAERAEDALGQRNDLVELQERLYRNAYRLGRTSGRWLGVRGVDDVMTLARFLYSILDIDLCGSGSGEITIGRCYFSRFYSPGVCRVMSAMDRGLVAGMAGEGELVFTQRITEGWPCCHARFSSAAGPSAARN